MSERWLFTAVLWGVHQLGFFATWALFGYLFRHGIAARFQVAGGKAPATELQRKAVVEVLFNQALLVPVLAFLVFPAWQSMGGQMGTPLPSLFEIGWQLLACILLQDTIFYWSHRALHHPTLYKKIHVKHHTFRHVRGHSAEYTHPVESTLNLLALMLPAIVLKTHLLTFAVWMFVRMCETVYAHSGYAFTPLASRHAFHHMYAAKGCLGSFFGVWDRLMGTDRQWREWVEEQPHP